MADYNTILGRFQAYASLNPGASYEEMYKWYANTYDHVPPAPDPFPGFATLEAFAGWVYGIQI